MPLIDFASAFEIVSNSILFAAVPKPKIDVVWDSITEWDGKTDVELTSIENLIKLKN